MNTEFEYELRPIAGYEGKYAVSNTGQVFSLNYHLSGETRELKPGKDKYGYLRVTLYHNGQRRYKTVHRLVLETFVPNPYNKTCCDHIDGDKTNNHVSNLKWCTHKENSNNPITKARLVDKLNSDETFHKMSEARKGCKHPRYDHMEYTFIHKKTNEQFTGTQQNFRLRYNLDQGAVSRLVKGMYKSVKGWIIVECLSSS